MEGRGGRGSGGRVGVMLRMRGARLRVPLSDHSVIAWLIQIVFAKFLSFGDLRIVGISSVVNREKERRETEETGPRLRWVFQTTKPASTESVTDQTFLAKASCEFNMNIY